MDRLQLMNVFVAVAEEKGFASGARRLRMSAPAVTRAVAELERRLGVTLLHRSTRHVRTTEVGESYLEDVRRILAEADAADESAAGFNTQPRGNLSVTAPVLFGRMFVMPGIVAYLERYPATQVSALFLDRIVNLLEEGVDVGIRIGKLPDSNLKALRVGSERIVVCASPAYLKQHGTPRTPRDLLKHSLISSIAAGGFFDWRFDGKLLPIQPRLSVTTNDAAIEAALCGFGLARLLSYQVARRCESGELALVLEKHEPPPKPIHIVHREGRHASAKVRAFVDLMVARLSADANSGFSI
jgi:DNA-binding transcriptional LysR family regulator